MSSQWCQSLSQDEQQSLQIPTFIEQRNDQEYSPDHNSHYGYTLIPDNGQPFREPIVYHRKNKHQHIFSKLFYQRFRDEKRALTPEPNRIPFHTTSLNVEMPVNKHFSMDFRICAVVHMYWLPYIYTVESETQTILRFVWPREMILIDFAGLAVTLGP